MPHLFLVSGDNGLVTRGNGTTGSIPDWKSMLGALQRPCLGSLQHCLGLRIEAGEHTHKEPDVGWSRGS